MDNLFHLKVCFLNRILYILDLYQIIDNGVDGKTRLGVDLQFAGDVAPMGGDGVYRKAQFVGYLLAGHTLGNAANNLPLALA